MGMHKVKGKAQSMQKMLNRLEKNTSFVKLAEKLSKWIGDEAENSENLAQLVKLRDAFMLLANNQLEVLKGVTALRDANYIPPKKKVEFVLERGCHVWIKPKFVAQFQAVLSADAMGNLFVDSTNGSKVVVAVGNPDDEAVVKHLIPKNALSATAQAAS